MQIAMPFGRPHEEARKPCQMTSIIDSNMFFFVQIANH